MNVEAVGEEQRLPRRQVRLDRFRVEAALCGVGHEHHDHVRFGTGCRRIYHPQSALVAQVQALSAESDGITSSSAEEELVGRSPAMMGIFKTIGKVACTQEPVLILGETGTGKELVANALHRNSSRAGGPLIKVNCAALSPTLLESELFGHERGAFTGAVGSRMGRFEQAHGGTLFLDEIGELHLDLQAKLLRVLQFNQFERVGGNRTVVVDVRVIAATNRDLADLVGLNRFRQDLYYRLNVVSVLLPPLRDRRDDIPLLAEQTIRLLGRKYRWPQLAISPEALALLYEHPWAGNIREMQNVLARAAIIARGRLVLPEDLYATALLAATPSATCASAPLSLKEILAETERRVIHQALEETKWNRTKAAHLLGISRRQLFDKILQYGLTR